MGSDPSERCVTGAVSLWEIGSFPLGWASPTLGKLATQVAQLRADGKSTAAQRVSKQASGLEL
jgi:hypothetical protein